MDGASLPNLSAGLLLGDLAERLHKLESAGDSASWEKAETYISGFDELRQLSPYGRLSGQKLSRSINSGLRDTAKKLGLEPFPGASFLTNARTLGDTWPEIFIVNNKDLPYEHYRHLATCRLPRSDRDRLRHWAENAQPKQAELRQRIRDEVDQYNGTYRPDFELKAASNFWKFNAHDGGNGDGAVHVLLYANLLYWFSEPGDTVLDPMAGTGTLRRALDGYRYFRESYEAEGSGPRLALMSDCHADGHGIISADATKKLPFPAGVARLAIIDPPYLRVADNKDYPQLGGNLGEWLANLRLISRNTLKCIVPGGVLVVMTDDVLRSAEHQPIAYLITAMLAELGLTPRATIYNHNPNYVYTMGPAQMLAAHKAGLQCNGCKVIQVAMKP